ncbi:MAG TPA: quinol:cytochrome C oxidoreductase, partial [Cyclobacteriaceae bacterium]
MAHQTVADEQYVFKPETKKKLVYLLLVGIAFLALGLVLAMNTGGGHEAAGHGHHGSLSGAKELVASAEHGAAAEAHAATGEHHAQKPLWLRELFATLWMNNVYFIGLGLIGLFFVAIQYAAQAGWSAGVLRIPLSMGSWIPYAG